MKTWNLKPKAVSLSNTYRALRFVGDATYGDLLYAEFTSQADWHYDTPVHYELFNMTEGERENAFINYIIICELYIIN